MTLKDNDGILIRRVWAMRNKMTFSIPAVSDLLKKYNVGKGWVDPFSGSNIVAEFSNNLAISGIDAFDYMKPLNNLVGVLFDPPYSMEQCKRSYQSVGINDWQTRYGNNKNGGFPRVKDLIADKLDVNGYVISFGWNSNGMGKKRGFRIVEILLIAHGGNSHDTIVTVEQKNVLTS